MDVNRLQQFVEIIDYGTMGAAARALRLSQSTLSRNIQTLERELGGALFVRKQQSISLTSLGRAFEPRARVLCAEAARARAVAREHVEAARGRVVIGAGPTCTRSVLPRAIANVLKKHPRLEIVVEEAMSNPSHVALANGEIEYSLLTLPPHFDHPDLTTEILVRKGEALILCAPDHPLTAKRVLHPKDVWAGPWVLPPARSELRQAFNEQFARFSLPAPEATVEYSFGFALPQMLYEGPFLTVAPELFMRDEIMTGSVRALRVRGFGWQRNIGIFYRKGSVFTPGGEALLEEIRNVCKTMSD